MNNDKNSIVDRVDNKKEFDRSICFTFFESYLEQGELVNINLGSEACTNYFIGLCRYALYKEEPQDSITKMLIAGLKNTIDAGQNKRAKSFRGEDIEMTNKILKYKQDNPNASYRQIAEILGCSKSKVGKVLSNLNNNSNNNSNLNLNSNYMDVDMDTSHIHEKKEKILEDLTDEELKELLKRYKEKEKYIILQRDFNLAYGSLSNEIPSQVENILTQREAKKKHKEVIDILGFDLNDNITLDMAHKFATKILKYNISQEEMQEDMNVHAKYGQVYTWNDFVNPPELLSRDTFYDYTAGLCSMLGQGK